MDRTVIIVDDSLYIVKQLTKFFEEDLKFKVVGTGRNGIEAVELYRRYKPDLLFTDIVMPQKSGLEAIEEILKEFSQARIIVVSAVRGDDLISCLERGAKGYIEKPLRWQDPEFVRDVRLTVEEAFRTEVSN